MCMMLEFLMDVVGNTAVKHAWCTLPTGQPHPATKHSYLVDVVLLSPIRQGTGDSRPQRSSCGVVWGQRGVDIEFARHLQRHGIQAGFHQHPGLQQAQHQIVNMEWGQGKNTSLRGLAGYPLAA